MTCPLGTTSQIHVRRAQIDDVETIARLLAQDELGHLREPPDDIGPYRVAFADIDADGGEGRRIVAWATGQARDRGCRIVQLTIDKRRDAARRFYELGFTATHEGMKLRL